MSVDYERMYYIMCDAAERAMNILILAQQQCEEIYLSAEDTDFTNGEEIYDTK